MICLHRIVGIWANVFMLFCFVRSPEEARWASSEIDLDAPVDIQLTVLAVILKRSPIKKRELSVKEKARRRKMCKECHGKLYVEEYEYAVMIPPRIRDYYARTQGVRLRERFGLIWFGLLG